MKIHPEQIEALKQAEAKSKSAKKPNGDFGELLNAEVRKTQDQAPSQGAMIRPPNELLAGNILAANQTSGIGNNLQEGQEVMDKLDRLLSEWENYAARLDSPAEGQSLRQAFGVLENIETGVDALKSGYPGLGENHPNLKAVVDELEILAVTERIKFNRGDYIE